MARPVQAGRGASPGDPRRRGALVFALPMLMTMEIWWLGFNMTPLRLCLLTALLPPVLVGVSHFSGIEASFGWRDDLRYACIAYTVAVASSAAILALFGVLGPEMSFDEVVGKVALQAIPASFGALLARSQLGSGGEERPWQPGYGGALFLMGVGALFLGLNVAPTEEMVLIAFRMTAWHAISLALVSLLVMHRFVYAMEFEGSDDLSPDTPWWGAFLRYTVVGYALALAISLYLLWTFGRIEGTNVAQIAIMTIVLGFPAAIGAAAARLIL